MLPLLFPLLAFVAGVTFSSSLDSRSVWICLPLAVLLGVARRPCALLAIFLAGATLRSTELHVPPLPPESEASRVVGTLLRQPEWRGIGVYLDLDLETIDGVPYRGRARLTEFIDDPGLAELFNALDLGTRDRIEVVVRLRRPARYRNPGVFDFRRHLERQGIFWTGTIRNPRLITVLRRSSWIWHEGDRVRNAIDRRLTERFAADSAVQGVVLGIVLGRKQNLTADVERDFQAGGLYHILVVSGFNLAVIAAAVTFVSRFLFVNRRVRLALVVAATIFYALLVGNQAPVTRAAVMVCIVVAGKLLDRDHSPLNAIALTALLLLALHPADIGDASFQMTFAAAAAVAGIGLPCARWMLRGFHERLRDFGNIELDGYLSIENADWRVSRRMFCERHGLPHWIVTLPWRIYVVITEALVISLCVEMIFVVFMAESFHRVSPISPLLNVPAGIVAAAVTPLGLLLIVTPPPMDGYIAWLVQVLLQLLMTLLRSAVSLPFASVRVPSAPLWVWAIYAIVCAITVLGIYRRRIPLFVAGFLAVSCLQGLLIVGDFSPLPPDAVTITFLDVGQGDSILIEFPDGRRTLIDGGGVAAGRFLGLQDHSTFSIGEDVVSAYLFSRGIRRLDTVVLTHAHNDHMDGLFDVLANFQVGELWLGRNPMIPAYRALIDLAQRRGVSLRFVTSGQQFDEFTVLHPPPRWRVRKTADNNDSVVLLLRSGTQSALFTGDLELPLAGVDFVSVLKVAHHGSKGVRMRVRSNVRVISVGGSNPFGHPHPSALPALRTDLMGAIQVRLEASLPIISAVLRE